MRWSFRPSLSLATAAFLTLVAACGDDGGNAPQVTEFSLTMQPGVASAMQGENVNLNAVATITSGPATDFTFAVSGAPDGVTATFPPAPVSAPQLGTATATLAIQVSPTAAAGTYTLTVTATPKTGAAKSTAATLTVTLPPSYTMTVAPTAQTLNQGGSGGGVVTITRTNFTGPVSLSLENAPPGVVGTFTPTPVTGTSSILQMSVAPTVSLGTFNVLVRAQAPGMSDRTAPMTLTISAQPAFTVSLAPATLNVVRGSSETTDVTLTRTNFNDGVAFTFSAPDPGITGAFVPGATTGSNSVLTVAVANTVAPGAYNATVTATGSGITRTATLTVNVALPTPAYTLTATPSTVTVQAGQSGTTALAIARTNFAGAIALSVVGAPNGVTGTFAPASPTTNASTLTLNVPANVAAGTYPITVRGVAAGLTDVTMPLTLTVTAAPSSISLVSAPESLFVFQGAQATSTVTLTRNNFAGDVTLTASGAPTGMTVSFTPMPVSGTTSTMTVVTTGAVAAGRHVLTVTGSGTGISNATKQVVVNVSAAGTGSLQFTFCDPARTPVFFAFQDSTGAWTPVAPLTSGNVTKYFFDLVSDRGGVAFITKRTVTTPRVAAGVTGRRNRLLQASQVQQHGDATRVAARTTLARALALAGTADVYDTFVFHLAKSEMNTLGQDLCTLVVDTKTNLVNVAGVSAGELATLSLGGVNNAFIGGVTTSPLTFSGVPHRTVDLVGTRYSASDGFEKGLILRNLNVASGGTVAPTADFDGPNAFVPAIGQATIGNTLSQTISLNSLFFTGNGEAGIFGIDNAPSSASSRIWAGVPSSRFLGTDLHGLLAVATPGGGSTDQRSVLQYTGAVGNATLTLPPEMDLVAITPIGSPVDPRYRAVATSLPAAVSNAVEMFVNLPTLTGNSYRLVATKQYVTNSGMVNGFDLSMPPLLNVTGFPAAARLSTGTNDMRVSGFGWTGSGITAPRPAIGDVFRVATRGSTVTVF